MKNCESIRKLCTRHLHYLSVHPWLFTSLRHRSLQSFHDTDWYTLTSTQPWKWNNHSIAAFWNKFPWRGCSCFLCSALPLEKPSGFLKRKLLCSGIHTNHSSLRCFLHVHACACFDILAFPSLVKWAAWVTETSETAEVLASLLAEAFQLCSFVAEVITCGTCDTSQRLSGASLAWHIPQRSTTHPRTAQLRSWSNLRRQLPAAGGIRQCPAPVQMQTCKIMRNGDEYEETMMWQWHDLCIKTIAKPWTWMW